jgi:molecular chaperone DnaK (HSP70)
VFYVGHVESKFCNPYPVVNFTQLNITITGAQANAEIKADRGRLTDAEIDRMIADAERYREEDMALARKIHLRNALEEVCYLPNCNLTVNSESDLLPNIL